MTEDPQNPRLRLIRDVAVFQLKLLVDGLRDALLIPVSFVAVLLGLLRGGKDTDQDFQRLLKLGRRSERWINLFGDPPSAGHSGGGSSLDRLLDRVEGVVREQYINGRSSQEARAAIHAAADEIPMESPEQETEK